MEEFAVNCDTDPQTRRRKIHCKQELIINSLQQFYTDRADKDEIIKLLEGTSEISLRLIDWFVTNYARRYTISYILNSQEFLVYMNYKSQLKAYSKKLFDPFCRRERIMFQIADHEQILTTVGKLNFFRWAIEKDVIKYIKMNLSRIEKEMNLSNKSMNALKKESESITSQNSNTSSATNTTKSSTRRRNRFANTGVSNIIEKHELNVHVTFD
jgi:hypothetical protein